MRYATLLVLVAIRTSAFAQVTNGTHDAAHEAVVKIQYDGLFHCSGTLIGAKVVLTAAHCLESSDAGLYRVVVDDGWSPRQFDVAAVIPHPRFSPTGTTDDIAILVLSTAVTTVMPIALTRGEWRARSDTRGTLRVVGFGQTSPDDAGTPNRLSSPVALVDLEDRTLLTGADPGQACFGDSGGALVEVEDEGEHLIGVTSTVAPGCDSTSVATRVAYYRDAFVVPIVRAAGGSLQPDGERCYWDGQCANGRCVPTVYGLSRCGDVPLAADRFVLGASCASDFDCASGECSDGECTQACLPASEASCPDAMGCIVIGGRAECHTDRELSVGCNSTGGSSGLPGLGLPLGALYLVVRRSSRACARRRPSAAAASR